MHFACTFLPPPAVSRRKIPVFGLALRERDSVCICESKSKKLVGISPNLRLWCSGDKAELMSWEGQRSRSQWHHISSNNHFGTLECMDHGRIFMKLITIIHYQIHMTLTTFQGHGFRGQWHRQHCPKMHFPVKAFWSTFAITDHLVWLKHVTAVCGALC